MQEINTSHIIKKNVKTVMEKDLFMWIVIQFMKWAEN